MHSTPLLHRYGFYKAAQDAWEVLGATSKTLVSAYSDGVNAYLTTNSALPLEFRLLNYHPEPWQPADTLVRPCVW